jgi:MoaA/NifB/PqqE/SkfB family radical SAM enzyme
VRSTLIPLPMLGDGPAPTPLPSPIEAYIEVTNRCNSKCATCPLTFDPQEAAHTLRYDELVLLVAQLPDLKRAVLHGIGEPLMNRDLPRMVQYLKERGVWVLFNSNAALLTTAWGNALIDCGLDELRVSIDGGTPETYERIRGIPAFERVVENVADFVRLKRERGADAPRVSFWVTGMRENIDELPAIVKLAARVGVDEVYLQRLVYGDVGLAVADQAIYTGERDTVERAIAAAEVLAASLGVAFRGSGAVSPREGVLERADTDEPWRGCSRPLRLIYVTANGNALPCCIAPFTDVPYGEIVLGNVFRDGVTAVWEGARYREFRARLYSPLPNAACRRCGVGWSL